MSMMMFRIPLLQTIVKVEAHSFVIKKPLCGMMGMDGRIEERYLENDNVKKVQLVPPPALIFLYNY